MKSINEHEKNKEIQEIEKISAIFAAILKSNSSVNNLRSNHTETANLWQEQLYE